MAEYIKKEAILDLLKNKYQDMSAMPASYYKGFQYALKTIEKIKPAADVSPVRHGRWAWTQEVCEDDYNLNCSSCGSPCPGNYDDEDGTYRYHRYHYCPNCGCKMDLEG